MDYGAADKFEHLARYPSISEEPDVSLPSRDDPHSIQKDNNKIIKLNRRARSSIEDDHINVEDVSSPYRIAKLEVGKPASRVKNISPLVTAAQLASLTTYLALLGQSAFEGSLTENIIPKLFFAGQVSDYLPNLMDFTLALAGVIKGNTKPRDKLRLRGPDDPTTQPANFPAVDLIICCCKEPVDVVLDTAIAACNLYWPTEKLNILVSDDGKDPQLKEAIEELGLKYANIKYFARQVPAGKHHGYKAGNMNQALKEVFGGGNASPYFCILDADMIPDQEMLSALVAHAVRDKEVGMVALPQDFYNIPTNDPLHENLILQHETDQLGRDKLGAAWCPGTGFIVRREAWESVGGFCEASICDDILFGWCLNGAGWKTLHVNERLQSGLQPETFDHHIKQRRRWWIGGLYNASHIRYALWSRELSKMSILQRLSAMIQCPKPYVSTVFKAFTWLMVVICLLSRQPVVQITDLKSFVAILFCYKAFAVLSRITEYLSTRGAGYANLRRRQDTTVWLGLHLTKAVLQECMPSWLGGHKLPFQVTGAKEDRRLEERNAATRPGPIGRIRALHHTERIGYFLVLFGIIVGLVYRNVNEIVKTTSGFGMWIALISGPLFPGLRLDQTVWFLSPILYAFFPPTMKERHAYMEKVYKGHGMGGYRPSPVHRGVRFTKVMDLYHIPYAVATAWAIFAWAMIAFFL